MIGDADSCIAALQRKLDRLHWIAPPPTFAKYYWFGMLLADDQMHSLLKYQVHVYHIQCRRLNISSMGFISHAIIRMPLTEILNTIQDGTSDRKVQNYEHPILTQGSSPKDRTRPLLLHFLPTIREFRPIIRYS